MDSHEVKEGTLNSVEGHIRKLKGFKSETWRYTSRGGFATWRSPQ